MIVAFITRIRKFYEEISARGSCVAVTSKQVVLVGHKKYEILRTAEGWIC